MKIALNYCYGGFGLSKEASALLCEAKGVEYDESFYHNVERTDEDLIRVIEKLGFKANDNYSKIVIEEYDETRYYPVITEYDGIETLELEPFFLKEELIKKSKEELIELIASICDVR